MNIEDQRVIERVREWLALDDLEEICRRMGDVRNLLALAERYQKEKEQLTERLEK